jgi:hypothetical protein
MKEWEKEMNEGTFKHPRNGMTCRIWRNDTCGFLCGYLTLPEDHPWTQAESYNDIDAEVHGGLTFKKDNIIGFDCGHYGDIMPRLIAMSSFPALNDATYRNWEYVERELHSLGDQAQAAYKPAKREEDTTAQDEYNRVVREGLKS